MLFLLPLQAMAAPDIQLDAQAAVRVTDTANRVVSSRRIGSQPPRQ